MGNTRVPAAAEPKPLDHHRHPRHPQPALWATERASPASAPRSRRRWRSLTTARRRPARRRPSCCGSTPWWPATTSPLAIRVSRSSAVAFATASCCANWLTNSWNLRANLPSFSKKCVSPFVARTNIENFNKGCDAYGLVKEFQVQTDDLYEGRKGPFVNVINCLHSLGMLANGKGHDSVPTYTGQVVKTIDM